MNLYVLSGILAYAERLPDGQFVDPRTGEFFTAERMKQLQGPELEEARRQVVRRYKNAEARRDGRLAESKRMAELAKEDDAEMEGLAQLLCQSTNGKKWQCVEGKLMTRQSSAVEITDKSQIPAEYLVPKAPEPDKKAIMAAINDGKEVPGAKKVTRQNVRIK